MFQGIPYHQFILFWYAKSCFCKFNKSTMKFRFNSTFWYQFPAFSLYWEGDKGDIFG